MYFILFSQLYHVPQQLCPFYTANDGRIGILRSVDLKDLLGLAGLNEDAWLTTFLNGEIWKPFLLPDFQSSIAHKIVFTNDLFRQNIVSLLSGKHSQWTKLMLVSSLPPSHISCKKCINSALVGIELSPQSFSMLDNFAFLELKRTVHTFACPFDYGWQHRSILAHLLPVDIFDALIRLAISIFMRQFSMSLKRHRLKTPEDHQNQTI